MAFVTGSGIVNALRRSSDRIARFATALTTATHMDHALWNFLFHGARAIADTMEKPANSGSA